MLRVKHVVERAIGDFLAVTSSIFVDMDANAVDQKWGQFLGGSNAVRLVVFDQQQSTLWMPIKLQVQRGEYLTYLFEIPVETLAVLPVVLRLPGETVYTLYSPLQRRRC